MFIPYTTDGTLKQMLQEGEGHMVGYGSVRYVEMTGSTLEESLVTKDPWAGSCLRENCFPCTSGKMGQCMKQGITYRIDCMICKAEGRESTYFGESARTMFDRGSEHLSSLRSGDRDSALVQHMEEDHLDMEPEYTMKLVRSHKGPMYRQIHEGVLIDLFKGDALLNRKGEWGCNLQAKLAVSGMEEEGRQGPKRGRDGDMRYGRKNKGQKMEDIEVIEEDVQKGTGLHQGRGDMGVSNVHNDVGWHQDGGDRDEKSKEIS